jgi:predicted rRNA methylase YqxC with S4 and FtsJ domains
VNHFGSGNAGVRGESLAEVSHRSPSIPLPFRLRYATARQAEARGKLATVPRVVSGEEVQPPADIIVVDCSFISLKKILPPAVPLLKAAGRIVALIKPQFEAGKAEVDKGRGVIKDATVHERVLAELKEFVTSQAGLCWRGVVESPLLGPAGNKEFLALIEKVR